MSNGGACLLDSNILLRMGKSDEFQYAVITRAILSLFGSGTRLCYTSQTLGEYWNAATRPRDKNGFGWSIAETDLLARVIERDFEFLPDSREVHDRWRSLLVVHNIRVCKCTTRGWRRACMFTASGRCSRSMRVIFGVSKAFVFFIPPSYREALPK